MLAMESIMLILLYQNERYQIIKDLKRFRQIIKEINNLVKEAYECLDKKEKEKARRYWYANIISSLDSKHEFLSSCPYTMKDSIEESTMLK